MVEVRRLKNYINGEWVNSQTTNYEDVLNPKNKRNYLPSASFNKRRC